MRLAAVSRTGARTGGIEVYLERALPLLRGAGHEVRLFVEHAPGVLGASQAEPLDAGAPVRAWRPDLVWVHGLDDPRLEAELLSIAPSLAFVHDYRASCLSGSKSFRRPVPAPCARRCGPACLALYLPRGCGGRDPRTLWRGWREQRLRAATLRRCAGVVTLSAHMRREVIAHGVSPAQVAALPCLPPWPAPSVRVPPGAAQQARLLYVGRLEREKGLPILFAALPLLARGLGRGLVLRLVGEGTLRPDLERAAAGLNDEGVQVELLGRGAPQAVAEAMATSDLLVLPSTWPEPYGLVGVEAGQHGLPVVAFRLGGVGEWLLEGESGALAEADPPSAAGLAAAALRCLADPVRHAELRAGARRLALEHTPARHLAALEEALRRAAGR